MNKFKRWLIRKLGGIESISYKIPNTLTIRTTLRLDREFSDPVEERGKAIDEIGKAILDAHLAERVEMYDRFSDTLVVRYTLRVVKIGE